MRNVKAKIFLFFLCIFSGLNIAPAGATPPSDTTGVVMHIYDGDTVSVLIDKIIERVRLLGIDAPELRDAQGVAQCYSKKAKEELKNLILNKNVRLTTDTQAKNRDAYGRLLRYVYLKKEKAEILVNEELIRGGYARVYRRSPLSKLAEFKKIEQTVQKKPLGSGAKKIANEPNPTARPLGQVVQWINRHTIESNLQV